MRFFMRKKSRVSSGNDQGLSDEGAVFGAAQVKGVGEVGELRQGQVIFGAGEGGSQPGSVHEQEQVVGAAEIVEGSELGLGVDGAVFGGVGDVDQGGLGEVGVLVVLQQGREHFREEFAVIAYLHGEDFVTGGLKSADLVAVEVAGDGGDYCLPGF